MTFTLPQSEDSPTFPAQAVIDATDLAAILAAASGTGLVSGCAVTPNSSGVNLNVNVASGSVLVAGATVAVSAATNVSVAAASSGDRRDIVTVNSSGTVVVTAGTPCSVAGWTSTSLALPPVKPAIPASSCLLAEVYVPGAATSITASNLVAKAAQTATSAVTLIGSQTLAATAASVTFSSIPGSYMTLQLDLVVASDQAGLQAVGIQFNGDTAAHYYWEEIFAQSGASGAAGSDVLVSSLVRGGGFAPGPGGLANVPGTARILVPGYAGTTFTKATSTVATYVGAGPVNTMIVVEGLWNSTAAITSITLTPAAGSFVVGSRFSLYGLA